MGKFPHTQRGQSPPRRQTRISSLSDGRCRNPLTPGDGAHSLCRTVRAAIFLGVNAVVFLGARNQLFLLAVLAFVTGACQTTSPAGAQVPQPSSPPPLEGTSWQLVRFQGGDDSTLTPDERAKYTLEFGPGGQLIARIDCNRGRGSWTSNGPGQLQFGPMALTRAACPEGSLHDQIVKQLGFIRSYVMRDGRLFLSLMADGGIYEFERIATSP